MILIGYTMDARTRLQKHDLTPEEKEDLLESMEENLHPRATQQVW